MPPRARSAALVLLAALLPYLPVLAGGFLFDDTGFLASGIRADPGREAWARLAGNRGLSYLTLCWDAWAWQFHPVACHATNLILHALACLAALAAGRSLLGRLGQGAPEAGALAGALLYALHPLLSGAVGYVTQRAEILAGLFAFLALHLYLSGRPWRCLAACLAGFLSKENALAIPALLAGVELALPGPRERGRRFLLFAALILGGVAALLLNPGLFGLGSRGAAHILGGSRFTLPRPLYALTQLGVLAHYARLALLPFGQHLDYDWGYDATLWAPRALAALVVLVLIAALAWRMRRQNPLPLLGLGWFLIALAPTSSLVPIEDVVVEHRVYTALWAPALAAGIWMTSGGSRRRTLGLLTGICLAVFTTARAATWASPERLWRESARACPGKPRPWEGLGEAEERRGLHRAAEHDFRRALALDPLNYRPARSLGHILSEQGRHEEAVAVLAQGLKAFPGEESSSLDLANSLEALGRGPEGVEVLRKAAGLSPEYAMLHYNLGVALIRLGRDAEAVPPLRTAVTLVEDPAWRRGREGEESRKMPPSPPRAALSMALCRSGKPAEAREVLVPALQKHPDRRELWTAYGMASSALGDAEGVRKAREALARLAR